MTAINLHGPDEPDFDWYAPLRQLQSLGSQAARPGSLASLAEARRKHLGQFFTPDDLSRFIWGLIAPAVRHVELSGRPVSFFDNSVGSGRLLQFCRPGLHRIAGVDVHEETINQLKLVAEAAGFECEFEACGMQAIFPTEFAFGLINPPFSVHLDSPTLQPYLCTTYGKFGPNTAALSQTYALAQSLEACRIVVAILPLSTALDMLTKGADILGPDHQRLAAFIELPAGSFREEGTEVGTALLVFDQVSRDTVARIKLSSLNDNPPDLKLCAAGMPYRPRLRPIGMGAEKPTIILPVTGDPVVTLAHSGKRIKLLFRCGLIKAKVMNAVLSERLSAYSEAKELSGTRFPKWARYTGEGKLDIEVHLAQADPFASLDALLEQIAAAGGIPQVSPTLQGYFKRRVSQSLREKTPFRHTVYVQSNLQDAFVGVAKKAHVIDPSKWGSPAVQAGEQIAFTREPDGQWSMTAKGKSYTFSIDEVMQRFTIPATEPGWMTVHEGLNHAFPALSHNWRAQFAKSGIGAWLSWGFQQEDLFEFLMSPRGAVCAWDMGLGKSRFACALILMSGVKHGLIATEAYLVPELASIIENELPIPKSDWQIVETAEQAKDLKRINIISVTRLRAPVSAAAPKKLYAHLLRRRIGLMITDEGELLANPDSQQSRAIRTVQARKLHVLTGTPIPNYPRDTLHIVAASAGDGTAAQPYGLNRPYIEPALVTSMIGSDRGLDKFRDDFVTLEWVTNEFSDTLRDGAKREIPKIANLSSYRGWLAPHIKRRLIDEPDVRLHVKVQKPKLHPPSIVDWDAQHLAYYLKVADEFADWFLKAKANDRRSGSLVAILARISAVVEACNYPQKSQMNLSPIGGLTSKQRWCINRLVELSSQGHRTIFYARKPDVIRLIKRHLDAAGVSNVEFHGELPIKRRTKMLDEQFRHGTTSVLGATKGCTQAGLNIPQADWILFYDRSWAAKEERQCIRRAVRPQQPHLVNVEYCHIEGSIDEYMAQMVDFKADAADAGLDWATPEMDDIEFLHLDTILERFVHDLAELRGLKTYLLRDQMKMGAV